MIAQANVSLRSCLLESFLLEDTAEGKKKSFKEGIAKWIEDIKERLKSVFKTFKDKVLLIFNNIKMATTPSGINEKRVAKAEVLATEIRKFDQKIKGLRKARLQATRTLKNDYEKKASALEEIEGKLKLIKAEKEKAVDVLTKTQAKVDKYEGKKAKKAEKVSPQKERAYQAVRGEIFKTYRSIVSDIIADIKENLSGIGKRISEIEAATKGGDENAKVSFTQKFKIRSKEIGLSFSFVASQIGLFAKVTGIVIRQGIVEGFKASTEKFKKSEK